MGAISDFMETNFGHFNARETLNAAKAWKAHLEAGGKMMVTLAGAMSTAKIGQTLSPLIREERVHAICCTGANLEEDAFNLLAYDEYEIIDDWRALRAEDEKDLYQRGFNRVTDTCIPETVMRHFEERIMVKWKDACEKNERYLPHEYLFSVLRDESLHELFRMPKEDSWTFAAMQKDLPVYVPGWEDSTTGNMFAAAVVRGLIPHHQCVKTGTEQMEHLLNWYLANSGMPGTPTAGSPSVGFFQIGGGIAGDFPICAVPTLIQDLKRNDVPFWGYFCQIGDAPTSYGGYSGAVPNEKITWGKLDVDTPKFMIQSDASIVAPLIFAYVRGD